MASLNDTHCHLNMDHFKEDLPEVLERAWEKGITKIVVPGIDLDSSRRAVELADTYPPLYAAVGVHPSETALWDAGTIGQLRQVAAHPKVVAIGEIGLDYYRDTSPRTLQMAVFKPQLELAGELGLPVIVHNRNSTQDVWRELISWRSQLQSRGSPLASAPGVLHSFEGSVDQANEITSQGFYLGINGAVTYKNARLHQEVVTQLSPENMIIETDAPFLAPHPHRGKRNEPAFLTFTAGKIAALKQQRYDSIARITAENAARLFRWEL